MKDAQAESTSVSHLTWQMDDKKSEITKKQMGLFPVSKKKKKKSLASSVNPEFLRQVEDAERSRLEEFEVVSDRKIKSFHMNEDLESDDTDEIIAMKRPRIDAIDDKSRSNLQGSQNIETQVDTSGSSDSDSGVEASRVKKGQKYVEKVLAVSLETDEIILTSEPSENGPSRNDRNVYNSGANSDSDASTDIDDILSRIEVTKKPITPKGKGVKASHSKGPRSSDEDNDSMVKPKKQKLVAAVGSCEVLSVSLGTGAVNDSKTPRSTKKKTSAKKVWTSEPVQTESVGFDGSSDNDLEEMEKFCEPKQGNLSWTKPVKKTKISSRDVVSFDDEGGVVVDKQDEADDMDSAGSADTDELFSQMTKKSDISNPEKFAKLPDIPKMTSRPVKGKHVVKTTGLNASMLDEFASGLDDFADANVSSRQASDSSDSESESDSGSGTKMVVVGAGDKKVTGTWRQADVKVRDLNVSNSKDVAKSCPNSKKKKSRNIGADSSDSDDQFFSCDSGSDEVESDDNDALAYSDSKKFPKHPVSKVDKSKTCGPKVDSSDLDSEDDDDELDSSDSDAKKPKDSVSKVGKAKMSSPKVGTSESDSSESEPEESAQVSVSKVKTLKGKTVLQSDSGDQNESDSSEADADSSDSDVKYNEPDPSDLDAEQNESDSGDSDAEQNESDSGDSDAKLSESDYGDSDAKLSESDSGDSDAKLSESDSGDSDAKLNESDSSDSDAELNESDYSDSDAKEKGSLGLQKFGKEKIGKSREISGSEPSSKSDSRSDDYGIYVSGPKGKMKVQTVTSYVEGSSEQVDIQEIGVKSKVSVMTSNCSCTCTMYLVNEPTYKNLNLT
jgi:hypothetical protein